MSNKYRPSMVSVFFTVFFWILLVQSAVLNIVYRNWNTFFTALLGLIISVIPFAVRYVADKKNTQLPSNFEIVFLFLIFISLYMGDINKFYSKLFWWDIFVHTSFGVIFAFTGVYLVHILNIKSKDNLIKSKMFIVLFSLGLVMVPGVLWEAFEFSMDAVFGTDMLQGGLADTIGDIMSDLLGALITLVVYYYLRGKENYAQSKTTK